MGRSNWLASDRPAGGIEFLTKTALGRPWKFFMFRQVAEAMTRYGALGVLHLERIGARTIICAAVLVIAALVAEVSNFAQIPMCHGRKSRPPVHSTGGTTQWNTAKT
jgi:hypothetical protein